jgi:hypothetical protein
VAGPTRIRSAIPALVGPVAISRTAWTSVSASARLSGKPAAPARSAS